MIRFLIDKFKKEASLRMLCSGNSNIFEVEGNEQTCGIIQKIATGSVLLFAVMMIMRSLI